MVRRLLSICLMTACAHASPSPPAAPRCRDAARSSPLELVVLGSGGPRSFGRAASGHLIVVDGVARVLVDVGAGVSVRLGEAGVDLRRLDTVLLTHLHIDHAGDLPGFVKARDLSLDEPMSFRIRGPEGRGPYPSTTTFVERLFGPAGAFAYLAGFRNPLGLEGADLPTDPSAPVHRVLEEDGLRVTSIAVDHGEVPAVAYRVEHAGRSVVISGDLAAGDDNLVRLAQGAQVLVYDAAVLDPPAAPKRLYELHTSPRRIGEVAGAARVNTLVLSHLAPPVERAEAEVLRSVRESFAGEVRFAYDCMRVPVGESSAAARGRE